MGLAKKISSWKRHLRKWLNSRRTIRQTISKKAALNLLDLEQIRLNESNPNSPSQYLIALREAVAFRRGDMRIENKKWRSGWRSVVRTILSPRASIRLRNSCPSFEKYKKAYFILEKLEIQIQEWRKGYIGNSVNEYYKLEATAEKCREIVKRYERNYWRNGNPTPFSLRMHHK